MDQRKRHSLRDPENRTMALTLLGLLGGAYLFYLAPWPVLYFPALLLVAALSFFRLDLALLLIPLFAPYFMLPKHFGSREFAPTETFLVIDVLACVFRTWRRRITRRDWERLAGSPFAAPALLLLLGGGLSTVLAADRHYALQYYRLWFVEPIIFFGLLLLVYRQHLSWRLLFVILVVSGVILGGIAAVQLVTQQGLSHVPGSSVRRVAALYGSPDNLGLFYDRVIPFALALLLFKRGGVKWKVVWGAITLLLLLVLFLTFSRGAWFATAMAAALVLGLSRPWGRWLVVVGMVLVVLAAALKGPSLVNAFQSGHSQTVERRLDIWRSSTQILRDHPLFGIGPDNFIHYYAPRHQAYIPCAHGLGYMRPAAWHEPCLSHPHDEVFDFWLNAGLMGLASFLLIELVYFRNIVAMFSKGSNDFDRVFILGAASAMLASLVHGLVDNSYFLVDLSLLFWMLCAYVSFWASQQLDTRTSLANWFSLRILSSSPSRRVAES